MSRQYEFRGHVDRIGKRWCWLRMTDVSDRSYPDELWKVEITELPRPPEVGSYVNFSIDVDTGVGTFEMPTFTWTEVDIERARERARKYVKMFVSIDED